MYAIWTYAEMVLSPFWVNMILSAFWSTGTLVQKNPPHASADGVQRFAAIAMA